MNPRLLHGVDGALLSALSRSFPDEESWRDDARWEGFLASLSDAERASLSSAVEHAPAAVPNPGPQSLAFHSEADVIGYGGAAGGGKTALLALKCVYQSLRSVVFRAEAKQLSEFVDLVTTFHGSVAGLNRQWGIYRMSDLPGHLMEWGGVGSMEDVQKWKGRGHDLIGFDEVTEMPKSVVLTLMTWLRSARPGQKTQVVMTFNPPGDMDDDELSARDTGLWVVDYFGPWLDERHPNPARPGELRWYWRNEEGEEVEVGDSRPRELRTNRGPLLVRPKSRTFYPALVQDNPYLVDEHGGGQYVDSLAALPEPHRTRMLTGDFRRVVADRPWQALPTSWVTAAMDRWERSDGLSRPMDALGCDVSRTDRHFSVAAGRRGWHFEHPVRRRGGLTATGREAAAFFLECARDGCLIAVDSNGAGASALDALREMGAWSAGVVSQSRGMPQFMLELETLIRPFNLRAGLWWTMHQILNPDKGLPVQLPPDDRLRAELVAPLYMMSSGMIQIEDKSAVKKRTGYTMDESDALMNSLFNLDATPGAERVRASRGGAVSGGFARPATGGDGGFSIPDPFGGRVPQELPASGDWGWMA